MSIALSISLAELLAGTFQFPPTGTLLALSPSVLAGVASGIYPSTTRYSFNDNRRVSRRSAVCQNGSTLIRTRFFR